MSTVWRDLLIDQLDFYWNFHLWPRLEGLTDEEYLWAPAPEVWTLIKDHDGVMHVQYVTPEPDVPPVTTIAWRVAHIGRDVLGKRARTFFGGSNAPGDANMFDARHWPEPLPLDAAGGLALLDQAYNLWRSGLMTLDDQSVLGKLGPRAGHYTDDTMAALAMHLHRETIAHGAEICLLRDLYRANVAGAAPAQD